MYGYGLTPTHRHLDLDAAVEEVAGPTLAYPRITPERVWRPRTAVMTSGNAMSHVYFKGSHGWGRPLALEEIEEGYPSLLRRLEEDERIALLLARKNSGGIAACRGGSWIEMGSDAALLEEAEPVFGTPRCGDLVVVSRNGCDLRRGSFEIPEHRASHGAMDDVHMNVPLAVSIPCGGRVTARILDIFPTVLQALGRPSVGGIDGRSLLQFSMDSVPGRTGGYFDGIS